MTFSPDNPEWKATSFLVASEMELYIGKSSEAAAFRGGEPMSAGNRLTKNSAEARDVLDDLYIIEKNKMESSSYER